MTVPIPMTDLAQALGKEVELVSEDRVNKVGNTGFSVTAGNQPALWKGVVTCISTSELVLDDLYHIRQASILAIRWDDVRFDREEA